MRIETGFALSLPLCFNPVRIAVFAILAVLTEHTSLHTVCSSDADKPGVSRFPTPGGHLVPEKL